MNIYQKHPIHLTGTHPRSDLKTLNVTIRSKSVMTDERVGRIEDRVGESLSDKTAEFFDQVASEEGVCRTTVERIYKNRVMKYRNTGGDA